MKNILSLGSLAVISLLLVGCTPEKDASEIKPQAITQYETQEETSDEEDGIDTAEGEAYTMEEVALHNTPEDCWTIIEGDVVDVTSFFGKHPGGDENLEKACGIDATEMFASVKKHDPNGYKKAKELKIGILIEQDASTESIADDMLMESLEEEE